MSFKNPVRRLKFTADFKTGAPLVVNGGVLVVAAGWSIVSQTAILAGSLVTGSATFQRTGADIAVGASGNIPNITIATWLGNYTPLTAGPAGGAATGRDGSWYADPSGLVLTAIEPQVGPGAPAPITTGEQLSAAWFFIRDETLVTP